MRRSALVPERGERQKEVTRKGDKESERYRERHRGSKTYRKTEIKTGDRYRIRETVRSGGRG